MKTASDRLTAVDTEWSGPLYLDASALARIYMPEAGSDELDAAIHGRIDLIVSDLAITEIVSAIARRRREGVVATVACARLHRKIMADVEAGHYVKTDLLPATHREAERLVLAVDNIALRAADALHGTSEPGRGGCDRDVRSEARRGSCEDWPECPAIAERDRNARRKLFFHPRTTASGGATPTGCAVPASGRFGLTSYPRNSLRSAASASFPGAPPWR